MMGIAVGAIFGLDPGPFGKPALDPGPGLRIGLARCVSDGFLELPVLSLLSIPKDSGLTVHPGQLSRLAR